MSLEMQGKTFVKYVMERKILRERGKHSVAPSEILGEFRARLSTSLVS